MTSFPLSHFSDKIRQSTEKKKFRISAFALAAMITTLGVLVTSACVATITSIFSEDAANSMAHQITHVMMEKTTLRINGVIENADGIARASQTGIYLSGVPLPYDENVTNWYEKWHMWAFMFEKALGAQGHGISFFFSDGSFASVSTPLPDKGAVQQFISLSYLGDNTPPAAADQPIPWKMTKLKFYNYTTMKYLYGFDYPVQMDSRRREGYDPTMAIFSHTYTTILSQTGWFVTLKVSYSMYNASVFLGVGEIQLRLDKFQALVQAQRPTANTEIIILGRERTIIAASVDRPILYNATVPSDYNLTDSDRLKSCSLTPYGAPVGYLYLVCLHTADTLGYEPLKIMNEDGHIPDKFAPDAFHDVTKERLGDLGDYYIAIVDYNAYFHCLDWIAIVIIPEDEILNNIIRGRNIAIVVSVALAICVASLNGFLIRLFLRPLAEIVSRMQSAAYLLGEELKSETDLGSGQICPSSCEEASKVDSDKEEIRKRKRLTKATEATKKLNTERNLSYLSDVAAIQTAYWGMVDELGLLRGYIPEHVRDQLLNARRRAGSSATEQSLNLLNHPLDLHEHSLNSYSVPELSGTRVGSPRLEWAAQNEISPGDNLNEWVSASAGVNINTTQSGQTLSPDEADSQTCLNPNLDHAVRSMPTAEYLSSNNGQSCPKISLMSHTNVTSHASYPNGCSSSDMPLRGTTEIVVKVGYGHADEEMSPQENVQSPIAIYESVPHSARATSRQAARFASLGNLSDFNDISQPNAKPVAPLPLFAENGLVERSITVAVINITGFHNYVFNTAVTKVVKDHEAFVAFVHEVAKRYGGVLDTFNGDKFWISFNGSTACEEAHLAATFFAYEVATTVNREALYYHQYLSNERLRAASTNRPPLSPQRPRFPVALRGVTIGVATGRAFVGPLGTKNIRRHTITSNAISEAAALERMAARYPDCGVMVGGDIIPTIEEHFQYMILDATALPGSGGLRRRVASVKGPLYDPQRQRKPSHFITNLPYYGQRYLQSLPSVNPFAVTNACFNAFLEGRTQAVAQKLSLISTQVVLSRQAHEAKATSSTLPDGTALLSPLHRRAAI